MFNQYFVIAVTLFLLCICTTAKAQKLNNSGELYQQLSTKEKQKALLILGIKAGYGSIDKVQKLLDNGVPIDQSLAMQQAIEFNKPDPKMVNFLIERGANINAINAQGNNLPILSLSQSITHHYATKESLAVLEILMGANIKINYRDVWALEHVLNIIQTKEQKDENIHARIAKIRINIKNQLMHNLFAHPNEFNQSDATIVLHFITIMGDIKSAKKILNAGYDIGYTKARYNISHVIRAAIEHKQSNMLQLFLKSGAEIENTNIVHALRSGDVDIVTTLINAKIDIYEDITVLKKFFASLEGNHDKKVKKLRKVASDTIYGQGIAIIQSNYHNDYRNLQHLKNIISLLKQLNYTGLANELEKKISF